jgi:hypothetical protein
MQESVDIFISYAHEDESFEKQLIRHLTLLRSQGVITIWHDRDISAGEERAHEIDEHLNKAHLILLLVSTDFLASEYCYGIEMKRALERHEAGDVRVIPVILRPGDYEGALFGKLHTLPANGKPITLWPNPDEAHTEIAKGLRYIITDLLCRRKAVNIYRDFVSLTQHFVFTLESMTYAEKETHIQMLLSINHQLEYLMIKGILTFNLDKVLLILSTTIDDLKKILFKNQQEYQERLIKAKQHFAATQEQVVEMERQYQHAMHKLECLPDDAYNATYAAMQMFYHQFIGKIPLFIDSYGLPPLSEESNLSEYVPSSIKILLDFIERQFRQELREWQASTLKPHLKELLKISNHEIAPTFQATSTYLSIDNYLEELNIDQLALEDSLHNTMELMKTAEGVAMILQLVGSILNSWVPGTMMLWTGIVGRAVIEGSREKYLETRFKKMVEKIICKRIDKLGPGQALITAQGVKKNIEVMLHSVHKEVKEAYEQVLYTTQSEEERARIFVESHEKKADEARLLLDQLFDQLSTFESELAELVKEAIS